MKLLKDFLNHFLIDVKLGWKHQREVVTLSFLCLLYALQMSQINLKRDGSNIDSPDWIKNKKSNNKSFQ